jgi:hypothetical protein
VRWLFACFLLPPKKLPELMGFFFAKLFSLPLTGKKKASLHQRVEKKPIRETGSAWI